jgi:RNA polymerase sigma-70 factor, ECF subfamily
MWVDVSDSAVRAVAMSPMAESSPKATSCAAASEADEARAVSLLDAAMERYASGDDDAFQDLYRHGAPRLRGFLLRLTGNAALAEDLAQEAFLRVHRSRGSFEPGAAALPWVLAITRNTFLDHARTPHARRTATAARADHAPAEREAPPDTQGEEVAIAGEMLEVVRKTLAELPVLQREAFILLRFEGLSVQEAAQVLGATEGAVKIRAFRAYEALRAALGREEPNPGDSR